MTDNKKPFDEKILIKNRVKRNKLILGKDRLRNKLFRKMGAVPMDDYNVYCKDIFDILQTFEKFSLQMKIFHNKVNDRLNLNDKEMSEQNMDKGMIQ